MCGACQLSNPLIKVSTYQLINLSTGCNRMVHLCHQVKRKSAEKSESFQSLFHLPDHEFLINDFSCAVKKKIPIQVQVMTLEGNIYTCVYMDAYMCVCVNLSMFVLVCMYVFWNVLAYGCKLICVCVLCLNFSDVKMFMMLVICRLWKYQYRSSGMNLQHKY